MVPGGSVGSDHDSSLHDSSRMKRAVRTSDADRRDRELPGSSAGDNQSPDFATEPTFACLSYVFSVIASSVVRADHRSDAALSVPGGLA